MIARGLKWVGQIFENARAIVKDRRRFSVHQTLCADDITAEHVADALVSEAHAQHGHPGAVGEDDFARDASFLGSARSWGDHDTVRGQLFDVSDADLVVPENAELCAEFPEILDEVVRERVVVIDDEEHGSADVVDVRGIRGIGAGDGGECSHGFVDALLVFTVGSGIRHDACAGLDVGFFVFEQDGPECDAGVGVPVEPEVADSACVDAPFILFLFVQDLHGADFWRSADGSCGESGPHDIEAGEAGFEASGDVGDDMHHVAVPLNGAEVGDFHRAELSDAANIVACEIHEHEVFGGLLGIGEERCGVCVIFCDGSSSAFCTGDWADLNEAIGQSNVDFGR